MIYLDALITVLIPILSIVVPGVFVVPLKNMQTILLTGTRIFAWSLVISSLASFLLAFLGIPSIWLLILYVCIAVVWMFMKRAMIFRLPYAWYLLGILIPVVIGSALFMVPYLNVHDGLPTGDSQKAIYWASFINETNSLPPYDQSSRLLNRDPVDFYTPALHSLTGFIMNLTPHPYVAVGVFSIVVAIAVAWVAATLSQELFRHYPYIIPPVITAFLVLTNIRFLRYLREPGYHFQNVVGEFFLFVLLLLSIRLMQKFRWNEAILFVLTGLTLVFTHQFSAFIAAFMLLPVFLVYVVRSFPAIREYLWHHTLAFAVLLMGTVLFVIFSVIIGLHEKLPHLFTLTPHLASQVLPLSQNPVMMGTTWLFLGVAGLILMIAQVKKHHSHHAATWAFIGATAMLLLLSQGPNIFIDIPPVRALFYSVIPLSIAGSYIVGKMFMYVSRTPGTLTRATYVALTALLIFLPGAVNVGQAFESASHTVRTNSTFLPEYEAIIDTIRSRATTTEQAVLTDDYNRRSSSWLILSNQPMFTRIAADLERQMAEAKQSPQRYELYLRQLDYEKIFSLGSRPEIIHLLDKHDIRWVTGVANRSETSFMHNPALSAVAYGADVTLFERTKEHACPETSRCAWLTRASTLVNDIGDGEDVFEHLPASIRASRVSEQQFDGEETFRLTSAPTIQLSFNVGDYVQILWDQEHTTQPDISLEVLVDFTVKPNTVTLTTSTGYSVPLIDQQSIIRIPKEHVVVNDKGFVTFTVENPSESLVGIDLIALGLARVP